MADELVDICDENNNLLSVQKMKSEAHRDGLWHRSAHIWIYNSKGDILLQLRAKEKELYPDMWDISAAGHVSVGEEPVISGLREIKEEIGLKVEKENLEFIRIRKSSSVFRKIKNNEFCYVYIMKFDGNASQLNLQDEEVQEIRFISITQMENELKNDQKRYVPHPKYWEEMIATIKQKIKKNKI